MDVAWTDYLPWVSVVAAFAVVLLFIDHYRFSSPLLPYHERFMDWESVHGVLTISAGCTAIIAWSLWVASLASRITGDGGPPLHWTGYQPMHAQ